MIINQLGVNGMGSLIFKKGSGESEETVVFELIEYEKRSYLLLEESKKYWLYLRDDSTHQSGNPYLDIPRQQEQRFVADQVSRVGVPVGQAEIVWFTSNTLATEDEFIGDANEYLVIALPTETIRAVGGPVLAVGATLMYTSTFPAEKMNAPSIDIPQIPDQGWGSAMALVGLAGLFALSTALGLKFHLKLWWDFAPWALLAYFGDRTPRRDMLLAIGTVFFLHFSLCGLPGLLLPPPLLERIGPTAESLLLVCIALLVAVANARRSRWYGLLQRVCLKRISIVWVVGVAAVVFYSMDDEYNHCRLFSYYCSGSPWQFFNMACLGFFVFRHYLDVRRAPLKIGKFKKQLDKLASVLQTSKLGEANLSRWAEIVDDLEDSFSISYQPEVLRLEGMGPALLGLRDQLRKVVPGNIELLSQSQKEHLEKDLKLLGQDLELLGQKIDEVKDGKLSLWRPSPFLAAWLQE